MLRVPARARRWFVNDTTIVVGIKLPKPETRASNPGSRSNYMQAAGRKMKLRGTATHVCAAASTGIAALPVAPARNPPSAVLPSRTSISVPVRASGLVPYSLTRR